MPGVELDAVKIRIITALSAAHLGGEIEVALSSLSAALELAPNAVLQAVQELVALGLVDRLEDSRAASLSASGLRAAKLLNTEGGIELSFHGPDEEGVRAAPLEAEDEAFVARLLKSSRNWSLIVEQSSLSAEEKARLRQLGEAFFDHPAAIEILRRSSRV